MTTPTTPTHQFDISSRELRDLLAPIYPLVSTDDYFPILCAITLESHPGGMIVASGTDRFRLGYSRLTLPELEPGLRVTLLTKDLRQIQSLWPSTRRTNPVIRFTTTPDPDRGQVVTVTQVDGGGSTPLNASLTYGAVQGDVPRLAKILAQVGKRELVAGPVGLNPTYMADFRSARRKGDNTTPMITYTCGEGKPVVVTIGDHFVGVLMSIRAIEADGKAPELATTLDDWGDLFK